MIPCIIWSTVLLAVFSHGSELHKQMTAQEVRNIFNTDHDNVPEYELVPIAHGIHENNPLDSPHRILQIRSFKRDIKLYLEPTDGLLAGKDTPIWEAKGDPSSPLGLKYTKIPNGMKNLCRFYQDPYNLAAISSSFDKNGEIIFEGTIGDDLVVRPLPTRLRKEYSRSKRSIYEDFPISNRTVYHPNLKYTYHHIVFKKKETPVQGMQEKIGSYVIKEKPSRSKRSMDEENVYDPKLVYPQILVIVDYNEYLSLQTFAEVKRYVISFWNAVDLRYRVFLKPKVRLNVAGIIVATEPNGAPYIQNYRTRPLDGPIVDADQAIEHMGHYFFNETFDGSLRRFALEKDFDMVMMMTQLNLCNLEPNDNHFDCSTLGIAYRGGACTVNMKQQLVEAVGLVEDNGGYLGIVPAAHEIGHLLGAPHDGTLKEDDRAKCPAHEGYIMTGMLMLTENVFKWSSCSMEFFEEFFHSRRAECLYDHPKKDMALTYVLPGKILSLDEQCDRITGTHACNKDKSACVHLDCFVSNAGGQCLPLAPAAEGSSCGNGNYCVNGKCVPLNTTEVVLEFAPPPDRIDPSPYFGSDDENYEDLSIDKE